MEHGHRSCSKCISWNKRPLCCIPFPCEAYVALFFLTVPVSLQQRVIPRSVTSSECEKLDSVRQYTHNTSWRVRMWTLGDPRLTLRCSAYYCRLTSHLHYLRRLVFQGGLRPPGLNDLICQYLCIFRACFSTSIVAVSATSFCSVFRSASNSLSFILYIYIHGEGCGKRHPRRFPSFGRQTTSPSLAHVSQRTTANQAPSTVSALARRCGLFTASVISFL